MEVYVHGHFVGTDQFSIHSTQQIMRNSIHKLAHKSAKTIASSIALVVLMIYNR